MGIFGNLIGLLSGKRAAEAAQADTSRKLKEFLKNQIDALEREGEIIFFNEISFGYITHVVMMIMKKPVNASIVRQTLLNIYTDEKSIFMINNSSQIFVSDRQIEEKLTALFPIAKKEYEAGSGEFLIRNTRKILKSINAPYGPGSGRGSEFDPTKVPRWSAKDLA
jgi:hypothetical protein